MSADLTVLVVDDDYRVATVHQGFVERVPGFRVVGLAHTAAQAGELARALQPDLVLMDIYLPDGDGLSVIRTLLDGPAPPIVLVISAATEVATVRSAMQLGAVHYLVKPFGFAALAERLTAIRNAQLHLAAWPTEATQEDVSKLFELLRPVAPGGPERDRLAPTLRLVYQTLAASRGSLSAAEIATAVGSAGQPRSATWRSSNRAASSRSSCGTAPRGGRSTGTP
jgi:response regulator of citrate/malate metabolism